MAAEARNLSNRIIRKLTKEEIKSISLDEFIDNLTKFDLKIDNPKIQCFVSHTWTNGQHHFAKYLAKRLNAFQNVSCWLDEFELKYGEHVYDKINEQLSRKTDIVLFILSPEFLQSGNCKAELSKASALYRKKEIVLIPVVYSKCEIPLELQGLLYADFTNCLDKKGSIKKKVFNQELKKLVDTIRFYGPKALNIKKQALTSFVKSVKVNDKLLQVVFS